MTLNFTPQLIILRVFIEAEVWVNVNVNVNVNAHAWITKLTADLWFLIRFRLRTDPCSYVCNPVKSKSAPFFACDLLMRDNDYFWPISPGVRVNRAPLMNAFRLIESQLNVPQKDKHGRMLACCCNITASIHNTAIRAANINELTRSQWHDEMMVFVLQVLCALWLP